MPLLSVHPALVGESEKQEADPLDSGRGAAGDECNRGAEEQAHGRLHNRPRQFFVLSIASTLFFGALSLHIINSPRLRLP